MLLLLLNAALACVTEAHGRAACEAGDLDACLHHARMLAPRRPWRGVVRREVGLPPRDASEAGSFVDVVEDCEAGDADSCEQALAWWSTDPAGMFHGIRSLHGCRAGEWLECKELAQLESYRWLPGHLVGFLENLCSRGYRAACPLEHRPELEGLGITSCSREELVSREAVAACEGLVTTTFWRPPVVWNERTRCGGGELSACVWIATQGWRFHEPIWEVDEALSDCIDAEGDCESLRRRVSEVFCASEESCARHCAEGDARACSRRRLFDHELVQRGVSYAARGCRAGHRLSCAGLLEVGARHEARRACAEGAHHACALVRDEEGLERTAHLFCADGDVGAGAVQAIRDGTEAAFATAQLAPVAETCSRGGTRACFELWGAQSGGFRPPGWTPHPQAGRWSVLDPMMPDGSQAIVALDQLGRTAGRCRPGAPDACHRQFTAASLLLDLCISRDQEACPGARRAAIRVCRSLPELGRGEDCFEKLAPGVLLTAPCVDGGDVSACLARALRTPAPPFSEDACNAGFEWLCGWSSRSEARAR